MAASKKRVIKSLDSLTEELKDLLREQYPNGYEGSISRIVTPKKEPIFVFPLETDDATYLIKLPATKNSDGEYDVEPAEKGDFSDAGDAPTRPRASDDDNFDNSGEGEGEGGDYDNDSDSSDYDEGGDGEGKRRREASYDPDFDG